MKTKYFSIFLLLSLVALLYVSGCAKKDEDPNSELPVTLPEAKFSWRINNGTSVSASESYFVPAYSNIVGIKTGGGGIDILLNELSPATYTIAPSVGITLDYYDGNATYPASSGRVVISENTGGLLSGSFSCTLQYAGQNSTLSGEFSTIPAK